jgi:hypothetical protein
MSSVDCGLMGHVGHLLDKQKPGAGLDPKQWYIIVDACVTQSDHLYCHLPQRASLRDEMGLAI